MFSAHALDRLFSRVGKTGVDVYDVYARLTHIADTEKIRDVAVIVSTLDKPYFDTYTGSNGNTIVAIIRNGVITTIFLRWKNQKLSCDKLGVDLVLALPQGHKQ